MLLAFTSFMNFKIYQMDVKSAFLNSFIQKEVYFEQPLGFESFDYSNHVFKLSKDLYGLKQSPRAYYERLRNVLLEKGFSKGKVNIILFIKKSKKKIYWLCKYMLMILNLVLLTILYVRNFPSLCKENLR